MKKEGPTYFKLEKLYLDCIDEHGNCFIIYRAKLKFYFLKFRYSALLFSGSNGVNYESSSSKKTIDPLISHILILYNRFLGIRGSWKSTDPALPLFSFKNEMNNELIWDCHHPNASVEIIFKDITYKGFGYADTLSLSIRPDHLPIDELRWGRFLSDGYTIVWNYWKGSYPVNKIFCNGVEYNDCIFKEDEIVFGGGKFSLLFHEVSIIRKGKLSEVLSEMSWMKIIFSSRIMNTGEIKYKAKSTLQVNSKPSATGWSLYETVTWGK